MCVGCGVCGVDTGPVLSTSDSVGQLTSFPLSCPQIGRSADSAIDLVVLETVTGPDGKKMHKSNSTISRYACRIQCERSPPYSARIYAAAFDTHGKIKLSVSGLSRNSDSTVQTNSARSGFAFNICSQCV